MIKLSSGLRQALMNEYGLGLMMNGGTIRVYNGEMPTSPDNPPNGSQLARITTEGRTFIPGNDNVDAGLLLYSVFPGVLTDDGRWYLTGTASGTATWWRWCWSDADNQGESTYYPRVDGDVGVALKLNTPVITPALYFRIERFYMELLVGS